MKLIKSDSATEAYKRIFDHIKTNNSVVVVWQVMPENGERKISESRLNSFHVDSGLLHFEMPQSSPIVSQYPVYCYSEEGQFIFKSDIQTTKSNVFTVHIPSEIQLLEEPDIHLIGKKLGNHISTKWKSMVKPFSEIYGNEIVKLKTMSERSTRDQDFLNNEFGGVSLDEEEKLFAGKRESPRARPKDEKWVKLRVQGDPRPKLLRLFDLSRGGMSFVTLETEAFPKGHEVEILGFEDFDLDDPLVGQIMSHRPIDENQVEFKIGIKFNEGQE